LVGRRSVALWMISATALVERRDSAQSGCSRDTLARRCAWSISMTLRPPATMVEA